jgi:hypothetical protein
MARTGLTKSQVKATREGLIAEGRHPSVDAVRLALGNTGSKSTIHKYLKELDAEDGAGLLPRAGTVSALQTLVDQLADKLHDEAERRITALRAEHASALARKDAELAALHASVARLSARLDELEGRGSDDRSASESNAAGRAELGGAGFGRFGALLANPRGNRPGASAFSIVLSGGRDMVDADQLRRAGLKFQ